MDRRDFLLTAGLGSAAAALAQTPGRGGVDLILDPADPIASSAPVQWAVEQLSQALEGAHAGDLRILICGSAAPMAAEALRAARATMPSGPESLALVPATSAGKPAILACGADARGLSYAVSELADRVRARLPLEVARPIIEKPANPVRSVMRQFVSELLDKPWFYDRTMWPEYLDMLAAQRFNRLHLAFGFGYDSLDRVADSYLLFAYPFLVSVPGYQVSATNVPDSERDRNLEALRFISEQCAARSIDFQLGLWMHGYVWGRGSHAQNTIEGLTAESHGPYCRDALTTLLNACPAVSSVALRIHGESGVAEGSYDFWRTVFDGVKRCGRKVEIDLHAKGADATMIDSAVATGLPVNLSPKYWAEHFGMPYHQTAIRDLEMPAAGRAGAGLMTLSEGSRIFTRYGYADLLRDDRKFTVRHRVFAGTQRILLWGDPGAAAAYSRRFQFCGSTGVDLMEPLTCRGRRGSGVPGTRTGYADPHLEPKWDWQKYTYWYRVWGRMLYNPDTAADACHRQFGDGTAARAAESALANASRILPLVTTAHLPSAACDAYWPEMYWNQPMAAEPRPNPYNDTPAPKTFQNAGPLDPQVFSRMTDFAAELLEGDRSARYSPVEVAQWLDDFAGRAEKNLAELGKPQSVETARLAVDVDMQAGLGRFFAAKFRAGVLYSLHERTGDRAALEEALKLYRAARAQWARVADRAKGVYAADLSVSDRFDERGHWQDRLAGIDQDIAQLEGRLASSNPNHDPGVAAAIAEVLNPPRRESPACTHRPPAGYRRKQPVELEISQPAGAKAISIKLHYRHVNQAERYQTVEMDARGNAWRAAIPAAYTDSPYPLQYYFECRQGPRNAWLYPGFGPGLSDQPYFVLHAQ